MYRSCWLVYVGLGLACGSTPIDPQGGGGASPPPPPGSPSGGSASGGGGGQSEPGRPPDPFNPTPTPDPQPDPPPNPRSLPPAQPPVCVCPTTPIDTTPLQTIELDGSRSFDPGGQPLQCAWSIKDRPAGSTEPLGNAASARTSFFVDLAGDYKFELSCKTASQLECVPCAVDLHAVPTDDFNVQLVWDTPTVDVDVHMLRGSRGLDWFSSDDLYFGNRQPNWRGTPGLDCNLAIDDTDGYGPEAILCRGTPSHSELLKLGVHYYSDDGIGSTRATVRVYCFGTLAVEAGPVTLARTNDWWDVGTIAWPGCQVAITNPPSLSTRAP